MADCKQWNQHFAKKLSWIKKNVTLCLWLITNSRISFKFRILKCSLFFDFFFFLKIFDFHFVYSCLLFNLSVLFWNWLFWRSILFVLEIFFCFVLCFILSGLFSILSCFLLLIRFSVSCLVLCFFWNFVRFVLSDLLALLSRFSRIFFFYMKNSVNFECLFQFSKISINYRNLRYSK